MEKMDSLRVAEAIEQIMIVARRSNKYIDETCPWVLAKSDEGKEKLKTVLYNLIETIRIISVMLQNIMPETAQKIAEQINATELTLDSISEFGKTVPGTKVGTPEVLFARIDAEKKLEELIAKANEQKEQAKVENVEKEEEISIDDVDKVKLKVAQILSVEKVPDAKKLYKLQVDLGYEKRTVVSGLVPYYKEEELVGKKVVLVSNLKPAKLRGIESNGMILAAGDKDTVKVLFVDDAVPLGEGIH